MWKTEDVSPDWIQHFFESFELIKALKEAVKYGSPEVRQAILNAIGSNYSVENKVLSCAFKSPFQEKAEMRDEANEEDYTIWGE